MSLISKLREPKVHLMEGVDVAIFDVSATVMGGYAISKYMKWNTPITILGAFAVGHLAHNSSGTVTPLSTRINEAFSDVPVNNSTTPEQTGEIRFSTF